MPSLILFPIPSPFDKQFGYGEASYHCPFDLSILHGWWHQYGGGEHFWSCCDGEFANVRHKLVRFTTHALEDELDAGAVANKGDLTLQVLLNDNTG